MKALDTVKYKTLCFSVVAPGHLFAGSITTSIGETFIRCPLYSWLS